MVVIVRCPNSSWPLKRSTSWIRPLVTALESGIVSRAEAALKVAEAAYRFGERGFLEVIDAQRVFRAARAELIAARYELATAWVEIQRLRATPAGKTE